MPIWKVSRVKSFLKMGGNGLRQRAMRGAVISLGGTAGHQVMRLLSNLALTRLLFPEAFGLMALMQTFMIGLQMFSDIGLRPSIIQNPRGEEPDFLNTAWTLQVTRGVVLWLGACALAWPVAEMYHEPQIMWLLPVVGLNAVIAGFTTTKTAVANRQIQLGLQTTLGLVNQALAMLIMVAIALIWPSVWALVLGGLASSVLNVVSGHVFMPGVSNRFRWEPGAARELMSFGKFIFLSTIAAFLIEQGDKLVLGRVVSLSDLGVYNIALFLAVFPAMLGNILAQRILFPLYRELRPSAGEENRRKINRARSLLTGGMIAMMGSVAILGVWLIDLLYDDRYHFAGPMLIVAALSQIPVAMTTGNGQLLLAEGNSRDFSRLVVIRGVISFAALILLIWQLGLFGALLAKGLVIVLTYPLQVRYLRPYKGNDLRRDAIFAGISVVVAAIALTLNWPEVQELFLLSRANAPAVTGSWAPVDILMN